MGATESILRFLLYKTNENT
ncbi:unnamed protein product, partial [Adineta steineri]